jgi:hypothetical protein
MQLVSPAGYGRLVVLDRERHRGLGVAPGPIRFGRDLHAIYLTAAEFFRAARDYPIVFGRNADSGEYAPLALTGLKPGENLFVDGDGCWTDRTAYVPGYVRRYPFCTAQVQQAGEGVPNRLICVDEAGLSAAAPVLFDTRGAPTEAWKKLERFITEMEAAQALTAQLAARLAELDLLEPFEAQAHPESGEVFRLTGLHRVNENRLNGLPGDTVSELMKRGMLSRVYAHLMSLDNFAALLDRHVARPRRE